MTKKTVSLREQILGFDDMQSEIVIVPEWGDMAIKIVAMNGTDRDAYEASLVVGAGKKSRMNMANMRAKLVQKTACDPETGERLFDIADVRALGQKNAAAIDRLFSVAQRLSGISDADVEELEGN